MDREMKLDISKLRTETLADIICCYYGEPIYCENNPQKTQFGSPRTEYQLRKLDTEKIGPVVFSVRDAYKIEATKILKESYGS